MYNRFGSWVACMLGLLFARRCEAFHLGKTGEIV
jgi:hypothetical protein